VAPQVLGSDDRSPSIPLTTITPNHDAHPYVATWLRATASMKCHAAWCESHLLFTAQGAREQRGISPSVRDHRWGDPSAAASVLRPA